jgi:peptidoglycan/xylan/chitin deacetylase (PgdA/CDA1 family)
MSIERKTLTLTTSWDDGHPLDLRIAELLTKHGLRGTFYVPLENSRPTLTAPQIHELSRSFEIGAHTVHHSTLTALPPDKARTEIERSKKQLEDITGKPCTVFCFPRGRYRSVHIAMLSEAGFAGARTVEMMSLDRPRLAHSVRIMPTTLQAWPHSTLAYLRNAMKRSRPQALWNLLSAGHGTDWPTTALALLARAARTGGVFHLWGHSWEIDAHQQWLELDRILGAMAEATRSAACITNSELCVNDQWHR